MELPRIVQNGMVGVVQLEQMLQRSGGFLLGGFGLVDLDGWDVEDLGVAP